MSDPTNEAQAAKCSWALPTTIGAVTIQVAIKYPGGLDVSYYQDAGEKFLALMRLGPQIPIEFPDPDEVRLHDSVLQITPPADGAETFSFSIEGRLDPVVRSRIGNLIAYSESGAEFNVTLRPHQATEDDGSSEDLDAYSVEAVFASNYSAPLMAAGLLTCEDVVKLSNEDLREAVPDLDEGQAKMILRTCRNKLDEFDDDDVGGLPAVGVTGLGSPYGPLLYEGGLTTCHDVLMLSKDDLRERLPSLNEEQAEYILRECQKKQLELSEE